MSVTVTLHAWYLAVWLAAGVVLFVPLNLLGWQKLASPRGSFMAHMTYRSYAWTRARKIKRVARDFVAQVTLWPLAAWEVIR